MHIHILGICGTFMGGIAVIAKQLGFKVTGSDANVYPPMSTQLEEIGIELMQGYLPEHLDPAPDLVIVGNAMSRGNAAVEYMLARNIPYTSGPQWLLEHVLKDRWVLAVSGTHGKTTTASMLAWILEYAKLEPGFLIGGVPQNFDCSARAGQSPFFVIEADEYDTAFFDKRSKFVHYRPKTLIFNNLEFDHADIFSDLDAIQTQFHHLIRMIPNTGLIVHPTSVDAIDETLARGCWTETETLGQTGNWQAELINADGSSFKVIVDGVEQGIVAWDCLGQHSVDNGMMAIAAARHAGVPVEHGIAALNQFQSPKRRMELKGEINNIKVIDDFAHHPTAITTTLAGLRANVGTNRIIAVLEPRSNTMKLGVHKNDIADSLVDADEVFLFQPANIPWSVTDIAAHCQQPTQCETEIETLVAAIVDSAKPSDTILVMSNGGFGGIHDKILLALEAKK